MPTRVGIEDYECWITVEGKDIEHYGAEFNEETKVVTCWIPSEENKVSGFTFPSLSLIQLV